MNKYFLAATLLMAIGIGACKSKPHAEHHNDAATAQPSSEAKAVAQQNKASYVAQVSFAKGSANLTDSAKRELSSTIETAARAGKIEEVKLITWADSEYPTEKTKQLSKAQRDLADRRNKTLRTFIKEKASGTDVDAYNMAERPNSVETLLSTSDARIKQGLETAGIATTAHDLRYPENASKSMVMVILKE